MSSNQVRITHITGGWNGTGGLVLSGTVIVHARVRPARRTGDLVTLSVDTDFDRKVTMRASHSGNVAIVVDTTQLMNGVCEITVRDLRGHADTRRVRIDNPLSQTGHFYYRDESRPIPDLPRVAGNKPSHSHEYYSFLPIICSDTESFQINFCAARPGVFPVEIRNCRGNLVRRLSIKAEVTSNRGGQDRGQHRFYASMEWDGKDSMGRSASSGDYLIQVVHPDKPGTALPLGVIHKTVGQKVPQSCMAVAGLNFVGLTEGATLTGDVLVQAASAAPRAALNYVMLFLDGELIATSVPIPGHKQVPLTLNTARFANGPHTLEVRDFHGRFKRIPVVFQNPVAQVRYEPDFDVNTGGMGPRVSHFTATLPQSRPWKVTLRNEKGQTVKSFKGNSKTILQAWDGNDDQGKQVPYGCYEILLHAANSSVSDTTLGFIDLYVSSE